MVLSNTDKKLEEIAEQIFAVGLVKMYLFRGFLIFAELVFIHKSKKFFKSYIIIPPKFQKYLSSTH